MSLTDSGRAVVLVYGGGRLESALLHAQDGGEAYMGPLLRKGVQYAKTHYDSGDITRVLVSEGEMHEMIPGLVQSYLEQFEVRHVYYVSYRWDPEAARKTYRVRALHSGNGRKAGPDDAPWDEAGIPDSAARLA